MKLFICSLFLRERVFDCSLIDKEIYERYFFYRFS